MRSIRRRLMILLAVAFVALIAATLFYVERIAAARVTEEFDAAILAEARALISLVAINGEGQVEFEYVPDAMPNFEREDKADYFQIWLHDGSVLPPGRSGSLPPGVNLARTDSLARVPAFRDMALPDGRSGRAVQMSFVPGPDPGDETEGEPEVAAHPADCSFVLVVARGRERLDSLIASTRLAVVVGGGAAALVAALLIWLAVTSGLRPLHAISAQVRALDAENLSARVSAPGAPSELDPIVRQLNALIARLEASFERERRFAGHVAHELRTPIAELRSLAEVGGRWPEDLASTRRFFADVHDIAGRMERVVVDLLLLARCHAGVETAERRPVRIAPLLRAQPGADRAEIRVPEGLVIDSDPGKLSLVLANLLENALAYATPGGPVRCVAEARGPRFLLEISNPSEPLTEEDLRNIAEPFWRKDRARSAEGHSGLGLSLVTALAELLGLEVSFRHEEGLFRARVGGPLAAGGEEPKVLQRFAAYPEGGRE
ncbi:MAG TPA: ATP-binding protein [Planctomycetota bacterium]|nr:ATP-binding protein [Planctomycetota bacterium]